MELGVLPVGLGAPGGSTTSPPPGLRVSGPAQGLKVQACEGPSQSPWGYLEAQNRSGFYMETLDLRHRTLRSRIEPDSHSPRAAPEPASGLLLSLCAHVWEW